MKQIYVLGMITVLLLLLWLGSDLLRATKQVEGFATDNVTLNFCPLWAPQVQTAKGNTDCCEGDMVDGKCNGKTFCTMSPSHDGVVPCLDAWKRYYIHKSNQLCPTSMSNYYENVKVKGGAKGCSASRIEEDGSKPKLISAPNCKIYATEKENRENSDSCYVEKERLKIKCPTFPGYTSKVEKTTVSGNKFGSFVCSYSNPIGQRNSCNDEKSLIALWDRTNPNWRMETARYSQLENLSCRTFLERERKKEIERQRIEAERRRADEERRKKEAMANRFRSFFNRFRQSSENAINRFKQMADDQKRKAEELRRRLAGCK